MGPRIAFCQGCSDWKAGGMYRVELYARVRRACHVEGMSTREASRVFGVDRKTVRKMLSFSVPPGYRRSAPPRRPKLGPFTGIIDRILEDDRTSHRKQRHTAKRIFDRLRDEYGFTGGYTIVKDYVREQGLRSREVFVPLSHSPGHAQADFGEAMAVIGGALRKIHFLAFDLPHSDGCLLRPIRRRRPKHSAMATTRRLPSSAASPDPSCTTTPSWRLPGSWAMGSGSERASSRSFSPTICSRTGSAGGQGQRQGQGRGTGRLHPAELPGPRPACRELRGPQRCSRRTVPPAPGGAAAGPQGDHRRASRAGSSSSLAIAACSL